jgi:hypothetical protein
MIGYLMIFLETYGPMKEKPMIGDKNRPASLDFPDSDLNFQCVGPFVQKAAFHRPAAGFGRRTLIQTRVHRFMWL